MDAGDGADPALLVVEVEQGADVHVSDPVAVGEHEGVGGDVVADAPQAGSGRRGQAGLGARDLPLLVGVLVVEHRRVVWFIAIVKSETCSR